MAVSIPDGYLTRPAASRVYNRSKRALERDLEDAYVAKDEDVLAAFQLVTNDRVKREAPAVTTKLVEQLKKDGKNPVWCVSEVWLEAKYGTKGEPKPEQTEKADRRIEKGTPRRKSDKSERTASDGQKDTGESEHSEIDDAYLPDNTEFLKERIRTLEREKSLEIERNEKREAKLFQQLEVKDRQISAWDEVTQGITRGLATGLITPTLLPGSTGQDGTPDGSTEEKSVRKDATFEEAVVTHQAADVGGAAVDSKKEKKGAKVQTKPRKPKAKATPKKKRPTKKRTKGQAKKAKKRSWLNTPISELFSRR